MERAPEASFEGQAVGPTPEGALPAFGALQLMQGVKGAKAATHIPEAGMPSSAPRICACGHRVAKGVRCPCQTKGDQARKAAHDATRPSSSARGYDRAWERAKAAFLAEHPRCARCGQQSDTVDHVTPHRGDRHLFWDEANWQSLCTPCHSRAKQSEERRNSTRT